MPLHEVVAFGDRLWWLDPYFGVFSVDPFSDRPEHGFVALPRPLPNFDMEVQPELYRLLGVSEGKLRYVELTIKEPFMLYSFSLDDEGSSWKLTHETRMNLVLPDKSTPRLDQMPWISAIDPFNANILYFQHGEIISALDLAEGERIGRSAFPDNIKSLYHGFVPLILPAWLPRAGTLPSKTTNCTSKTLADMLAYSVVFWYEYIMFSLEKRIQENILIPYNEPTTELMVVLEDMDSHFGEILGQSWHGSFADALPEPCSWRTS
uniref:DUF1618 domain-containing protein n=1 Tax=Aegilops tauschii TaxID=37682 RepID=M8BND0_AEGTA